MTGTDMTSEITFIRLSYFNSDKPTLTTVYPGLMRVLYMNDRPSIFNFLGGCHVYEI